MGETTQRRRALRYGWPGIVILGVLVVGLALRGGGRYYETQMLLAKAQCEAANIVDVAARITEHHVADVDRALQALEASLQPTELASSTLRKLMGTRLDANETIAVLGASDRGADFPLYQRAAHAESALLAPWRRRALLELVVTLALLGGLLLVAEAVRRLALRQNHHKRALEQLTHFSGEALGSRTESDLLKHVSALARELVPAHQALACLRGDETAAPVCRFSRRAELDERGGYETSPTGAEVYRQVTQHNVPVRLDHAGFEAGRGVGASATSERADPGRDWLAVPMVSHDGNNLGLLQLCDRDRGTFTRLDQNLLTQLARITAAAVDNIRLLQATETSRAEAEAAGQRLERMRDSISDGLYVLDREWRYVTLNRSAERLLGVHARDVLGRSVWELQPTLADTELAREFQHAMTTREARNFTFSWEGQHRLFEVRVFPSDEGISVFFQDITEQRKAEEQRHQAQRLEIVGQLTGGIAHDFNNLLTVILGETQFLRPSVHDKYSESLEAIIVASERAAELTRHLLAFARRQPLAPQILDLGGALADLEKMLQRMLGADVDLEVVRSSGLWTVEADPSQFEAAIMNLAVNARDAMPNGGKLSIEITNARVDDNYADLNTGITPGQYVMTAVTDNGAGMSPQTLAHVFEPFFTTKGPGEGTGLGLSMVYGFFQQSGGHVKVYSEPGEGTTVRVYLPRAPGKTIHAGDPAPATVAGGNETVLVVEDDALVRSYTVRMLTELGYRPTAASDGPTALELINDVPRIDLLLTDVVLPGGMGGREVATAVLTRSPQTRVLYTSGYSDTAIRHQGRLDPGIKMLNKPFTREHLAGRVRAVLDA